MELYFGIKNLLDWTPWESLEGLPYLGNTNDPFEQNTTPNSLVFDPAYVYGPNQDNRMVVPRFFEQSIENKPITVFGNGQQTWSNSLFSGVIFDSEH